MADDFSTTDYLGQSSPVSLNEKPALPVGGAPAGASSGPFTGGTGGVSAASAPSAARSPVGTLNAPSAATPGSSVTTTPNAAPGVPGKPVDLRSFGGESGKGATSIFDAVVAALKLGKTLDEVLEDFGFGAETFGRGESEEAFQAQRAGERLDFTGSFGAANETTFKEFQNLKDPFGFGDFATEGVEGALPAADMLVGAAAEFGATGAESIPTDFSGGFESAASVISPALKALSTFLPMLGKEGQQAGAGVAAISPFIGDLIATSGQGISPLTLFNIPQAVNSISETFDPRYDTPGSEAWLRRQKRSDDAASLQSEILSPIFSAKSPEEFVSALAKPVGGSTAGDALAAILHQNLSGEWYGQGTTHNWLPDTALLPLLNILTQLGYMGKTQPTRGDVGGVGEIVAGGGAFLPLQGRTDYTRSGGYGDSGEGTALQDAGGFDEGGRGASVGWDRTLRALTSVVTGDTIAATQPFDQRSGYGTNPGTVSGDQVPGGDPTAMYNRPVDNVSPEYLATLDAYDPAVAARVREALARQADQDMVNAFTAGGGGTG